MGALQIFIGVVVLLLTLIILIQPVLVAFDDAQVSLDNAGNTIKYGTDSEGNIVEVGTSSALPDITLALLSMIGFFIVVGFIIWIIRGGNPPIEQQMYGGYR